LAGIILGLLGALYVKLKVVVADMFEPLNKRGKAVSTKSRKYILAFVVALLTG